MTAERTLIMFKPDFTDKIIYSDEYLLENVHDGMFSVLHLIGLDVAETRIGDIECPIKCNLVKIYRNMPRSIAEAHYFEHKDKPFFEELVTFITTGKCYLVVLEGNEAVSKMRTFVGLIRSGPYAKDVMHNLMHASDSVEAAEREINLHFGEIK